MISKFNQIEELFKEIDSALKRKIRIFVIGGVVLLQQASLVRNCYQKRENLNNTLAKF